jgi:hypothetical protein
MAGSDLVISVGASIRDLERQMKAASQVAEKAADEIEAKFRQTNPTLAGDFGLGLLKGAIAGIAFDKITRGIIEANAEFAKFGETAKRVGLDVGKFQELRLAAAGEGISGKSFDAGIDGLAKALNEARREENELTKLLDANGIKYKDRRGEIISTNEALAIAADLINRAATEQDKVDIAKRLSIPTEFIPLLENGAAALSLLAQNAREAGSILDAAWAAFGTNAKSAVVVAAQGLATLVADAQKFVQTSKLFAPVIAGGNIGDTLRKAGEAEQNRELNRAKGFAGIGTAPSDPLVLDVRKRTKIPPKSAGSGGGGSSGKSEEESAQARLEKYIETLMRQNSVLDAEIATVGKSNAEKRAAVELAKAQVDLGKLDEDARQKVIAGLTREIELSETKRTQLESLKNAQKGLVDAQKFFGNAAVDALEDLIVNGAKAEDVVKNLAKSLAKAALQAALMGSGPLAGIFGTTGVNGATGGLIGSLFGRATGGPVNSGQPYRVGERGPETFVPTVPGKIVPNGRGGGMRVVINNNASNQVAASAQQQPNGDLSVVVASIEGQIARNVVRGQGALSPALTAVRTGRQLRG